MSMNLFAGILKASTMFDIQNVQYSEVLLLSDSVAAGTQKTCRVSVSALGHFLCNFITGSFTTQSTAGAVVDDGIDYLRGKLIDGGAQRALFSDYIPLHLFLTPGRRRSLAAGAVSNTLFYPLPLEYLFTANSEIVMDVKNDSDVANSLSIAFHGVRIKSAGKR
jgi:hypothetical protein